jgi:hypothetical protein
MLKWWGKSDRWMIALVLGVGLLGGLLKLATGI